MFSIAEAARMPGARVRILASVFLAFFTIANHADASSLDSASTFLLQSQRTDGAIAGAVDIATVEQATAEALTTHAVTGAVRDAGLAFLNTVPPQARPTEYLARFILASSGGNTDARNELLIRQNADGGFGAMKGADSNVLDTAYALEALSAMNMASGVEAQRSVTYLLNSRSNIVWTNAAGAADAALSLRAWHALFPLRHTFTGVGTALDVALTALETMELREDFLIAQLVHARMLRAYDASEYSAALQAFDDRQQPDGSWSGDVYSTALAVRVLKTAAEPYPNPDLGSLRARVVDAEYGTALAGITVTLDSHRVTTTDADGNFAFAGLPAGTVNLHIQPEGYGALVADLQLGRGQHLDLGDLALLSGAPATGAVLRGIVQDAGTGMPFADAHVSLAESNTSAVTNAEGQFTITGLQAGKQAFAVSRAGYESASVTVSLADGATHMVSITLNPQGSGRFSLHGTVTDGETGLPLGGATVRVGGDAGGLVTTGADGNYRLADLPTGYITLDASLDGYRSTSVSAEVRDGQALNYSPKLYPEGASEGPAQQGGVTGIVQDLINNASLAGVNVTLNSDTNSYSAITDSAGRFGIDAPPGSYELTFALGGYRDSVREPRLAESVVLDLGNISLSPEGYYPVITVFGTVLDSVTNEPLPSANITIVYEDGRHNGSPDLDGQFAIVADGDREATIRVEAAGYRDIEWQTVLPEESVDVGQLRLRPEGIDELRADLTLRLHDLSDRHTDPESLIVSGTVVLELANIGRRAVARSFDVVAFRDMDSDGIFNPDIDTELGRAEYDQPLAADAIGLVELTLSGELPFRDAPVNFMVDPANHVIELRDDNNVTATLDACRTRPGRGEFNPVEKWRWSGGRVTMTPLAAPLMDTNGDGVIDVNDDVFVVFVFYETGPDRAPGTLVAVNGRNGEEAWRFTDVAFNAPAQLAIGDIDGDGLPEIAGTRYRTGLIVVNGDGTLKWQSDHPTHTIGLSYGGPALADLDADGKSEIVVDRTVLNHDGSLRWTGSESVLGESLSIVADIDLDGRPEVIVGPAVYDANGNLLWKADVPNGKAAVANFNDDPYPEIIVSGGTKMHMFNYRGEKIWGPVIVSTRSTNGSPTIGDVNGDGIPEIGVSGFDKYYVYNADGSRRWQQNIRDDSQRTGSTFFDLDGDNRVEAIYFDQYYLRVFDGDTGTVLFSVPNFSVTTQEYPIVADVDSDNHAEIVIVSFTPSVGIRVFEDQNDSWVNARRIWNQHAYHITNINDDMSIPAVEQNNWETYNNYRVNAVPDPARVADLTASLFALRDHGPGQPLTATLRVGNGGGIDARNVAVAIYTTDPAAGGTLWAETVVPVVTGGEYVDVELTGATLPADPLTLYAQVNADGSVSECLGHNNSLSLPAIPMRGAVSVATDSPVYAPEFDALLTAVVENTGTFTRAFEAGLRIEDNNGNIIVEFTRQNLGELASGGQRIVQEHWNTARYLAGNYRLRGNLYAADGELLASDTADFSIEHDGATAPLAGLRLATDRVRYHTSDQVRFDLLAQNRSVSTILHASSVRLTVTNPAGGIAFDQALAVRELASGNTDTLLASQLLNQAVTGEYRAIAVWRAADNGVLAVAERRYEVFENLVLALRGTVTVSSPTLYVGDPQLCTESALNTGTLSATVQLRHTLARLDQPGATIGAPVSVTLEPDVAQTWLQGVNTGGFAAGDYACILEAEIEGAWQSLGNAVFRLLPPPIRIDAAMQGGERGRLLMLLDPGCADRDPPEVRGNACDADPYGPDFAAPLPIQREHLEAVLANAGWTYTIVTSAEAFETAFASKGYELYALFSEQLKLPEALQRAVVADIEAGRGLLVAGNHDRRNGRLEDALGIQSLGKNLQIEALVTKPFGAHAGGEIVFDVAHWPNAMRLEGAAVLGEFRLPAKGGKTPAPEPALTSNAHGEGSGIYAGFDWPAQSALQGDSGDLAGLLTASLDVVHTAPYVPVAGRVFPLRLTLQNEGIATPGEVHLALPFGAALVEGPPGTVITDGIMRWSFALAEEQQLAFDVWLRLPDVAGPLALEAVIYTDQDDSLTEHTRTHTVLNVQAEE